MTRIGPVTLTVSDLPRSLAFYTERLGFRVHANDGGTARLGAGSGDLLVLVEDTEALPAPGSTGLFHFAVLFPSRPDLALALAHLVETRTRLQGASDHLVSEALYLADPEGNGIELYRDRSRDEWVWEHGQIKMTTEPLDVDALYEEGKAGRASWNGLPAATIIGHIHLRVAHIEPAEKSTAASWASRSPPGTGAWLRSCRARDTTTTSRSTRGAASAPRPHPRDRPDCANSSSMWARADPPPPCPIRPAT